MVFRPLPLFYGYLYYEDNCAIKAAYNGSHTKTYVTVNTRLIRHRVTQKRVRQDFLLIPPIILLELSGSRDFGAPKIGVILQNLPLEKIPVKYYVNF